MVHPLFLLTSVLCLLLYFPSLSRKHGFQRCPAVPVVFGRPLCCGVCVTTTRLCFLCLPIHRYPTTTIVWPLSDCLEFPKVQFFCDCHPHKSCLSLVRIKYPRPSVWVFVFCRTLSYIYWYIHQLAYMAIEQQYHIQSQSIYWFEFTLPQVVNYIAYRPMPNDVSKFISEALKNKSNHSGSYFNRLHINICIPWIRYMK